MELLTTEMRGDQACEQLHSQLACLCFARWNWGVWVRAEHSEKTDWGGGSCPPFSAGPCTDREPLKRLASTTTGLAKLE